jgi:CRISPR/Cas system endoribonuclease Cas6 (RAMP superfamily)
MMLSSFVIHVQPRWPFAPDTWLGPALQAVFLDWVRELEPTYARELHDGLGLPPYSLSGLLPVGDGSYLWRWGALNERVREAMLLTLLRCLRDTQLLGVPCRFRWLREHPLSRSERLTQLVWRAHRLKGQPRLVLLAPATFRLTAGKMMIPTTGLVIGNLLRRWEAHAALPLPDGIVAVAEKRMKMWALGVRAVRLSAGKRRLDCVQGAFECVVDSAVPYRLLLALKSLLLYANYAGVGAKTAMGLGAAMTVPTGLGAGLGLLPTRVASSPDVLEVACS